MPKALASYLRPVLTVLVPLVCAVSTLLAVLPPSATSAKAPDTEFSAERAYAHLERIAQKPRPTGSAHAAEVRDYLVRTLTGMGLTTEVQRATGFQEEWPDNFQGAQVENVVARLKGTGDGEAVMLAAHYDSVPNAPGANDNGVAVAALLEAIRTIKATGPPQRDIILLFPDAEEIGSFGSQAFVDHHRWAADVEFVLNFEARGKSGPSIMFESRGLPIDVLNKTGTPVASSLSETVYGLLGHHTDFTVFEEAGMGGLNLAYVGELMHYHTPVDSLEHVEMASLQHHGEYATDIGSHLASSEAPSSTGKAVYFTLPFLGVVSYPVWVTYPLSGLALVLLAAAVVVGVRRRQLAARRLIRALPLSAGATVIGALVPFTLWQALGSFYPGYDDIANGDTYNSGLYLAAFGVITSLPLAWWVRWSQRKVTTADLAVGAALWWAVLMSAAVFLLPEVACLFAWPLLAVALTLLFPRARNAGYSIAASVGLLLLAPAIYLALLVSGLEYAWIVFALAASLITLILAPFHWPWPRMRWVSLMTPIAAATLLATSLTTGGFDKDRPDPGSFFYLLDSDTEEAWWGTIDEYPQEWTETYGLQPVKNGRIPKFFLNPYPFQTADAPAVNLPGPEVKVLDNDVTDGVRTVRLRVRSPRRPPVLVISSPSEHPVRTAVVNGTKVTDPPRGSDRNTWSLHFTAPPAKGLDITLEVGSDKPFPVRVFDRSFSIEEVPELAEKVDRPAHTMPGNDHGDFVMTSTTIVAD